MLSVWSVREKAAIFGRCMSPSYLPDITRVDVHNNLKMIFPSGKCRER